MLQGVSKVHLPLRNLWLFFNISIVAADVPNVLSTGNMDKMVVYFIILRDDLVDEKSGLMGSFLRSMVTLSYNGTSIYLATLQRKNCNICTVVLAIHVPINW